MLAREKVVTKVDPLISNNGERDDVRRDEIFWLQDASPWPALTVFMGVIDQLRQTLNQHAFLGLQEVECHAACYRPGGFYKPHRDVFAGTESRVITFVYFLNPDWQPAHEGQLQLIEPVALAIEPRMDRLVLFKSQDVLHQVLPTQAERYTLTGWMRTGG